MAAVKGKESEVRQSYWDNYWSEHSSDHTIEGMMFDTKAAELDKEDRPEVLSMLPSYEGKSVLELGAGIGRFTADFAKTAGQLVTMDLIESLIKKNESINGHHKNVKFVCADVASPDFNFSAESFDLIFSSWLLLYLSDEEVKGLAQRMLKWLKVGGHIFFRESCFRHSGDHERKNNPSYYRKPEFYTKVFKDCHLLDDSGNSCEFSLVNFKCLGAYVKIRKDHNQICWTWQKVRSGDDRGFLQFFEDKCSKILRYELAFGEGFLSTGGIDATREFVTKLDLQPGQKVLDVGCGTGGADFYMAEKYDVHVVGIDLSVDMISFALERAIGRKCVVEFEVADCTKKEYPHSTFDVIYSRDTILHIHDKPALLRSFYKWLKPGGKVLISCYCKRAGSPSEGFAKYIMQEGYDVQDVEASEQMLRDAGFDEIIAEDRTEQFVKNLQKELDNVQKNKETFIKDFSEEDYNDIVGGLKSKLMWGGSGSGSGSSSGELRWGLFIAKKKL